MHETGKKLVCLLIMVNSARVQIKPYTRKLKGGIESPLVAVILTVMYGVNLLHHWIVLA